VHTEDCDTLTNFTNGRYMVLDFYDKVQYRNILDCYSKVKLAIKLDESQHY